jgi:hypothetical protein
MHARVKGAAAIRLGGAVFRRLGPAPRVAALFGATAVGERLGGAPLREPGRDGSHGPNGDDRIVPSGAMLSTSLAAQSAFGRLIFQAGAVGGQRHVPAYVELRDALAAGARDGVSDVTIAGSPAHDFALCLRYAHIPGANRKLRIIKTEPMRKSFLVLFFKKERLTSLLPVFRMSRTLLAVQLPAASTVARSLAAQLSSAERIT